MLSVQEFNELWGEGYPVPFIEGDRVKYHGGLWDGWEMEVTDSECINIRGAIQCKTLRGLTPKETKKFHGRIILAPIGSLTFVGVE